MPRFESPFGPFGGGHAPKADASGAAASEPTRVLRTEPFTLRPGIKLEVHVVYGADPKHLSTMKLGNVVLEDRRMVTEIDPIVGGQSGDGISYYRLEPDENVVVNRRDVKQLAMERAIAAGGFTQAYGEIRKIVDTAPAGTVKRGNIVELLFVAPAPVAS
jgi:hypothetical protein